MAGFDTSFWIAAVIGAVMALFMFYGAITAILNKVRSQPREGIRGFEVMDIEDHWHGSSTGPYLTGLGVAILALGVLVLFNVNKASDALLGVVVLLFSSVLLLTGVSHLHHQKREKQNAQPGRLTVSQVPLVPGTRATFSFRRALRPGFKPISIQAQLRFEAGHTFDDRVNWNAYGVTELPDTPLTFDNDRARTTWELEIPETSLPASDNLSGGRIAEDLCRWVLRVVLKDEDGQELDSCFHLPFAYPVLTFTASPH